MVLVDLPDFLFVLMMLIVAIAFVINIRVRKPGKVGLAIIIIIGLAEFVASIIPVAMGEVIGKRYDCG